MSHEPVLIHNKCHYCGTEMTWDRMDFLRCPLCDAESHQSVDSPKMYRKVAVKATNSKHSQYIKVKGPKSSSKSKGRSTAREKMKKSPTGTLYQRLFLET